MITDERYLELYATDSAGMMRARDYADYAAVGSGAHRGLEVLAYRVIRAALEDHAYDPDFDRHDLADGLVPVGTWERWQLVSEDPWAVDEVWAEFPEFSPGQCVEYALARFCGIIIDRTLHGVGD